MFESDASGANRVPQVEARNLLMMKRLTSRSGSGRAIVALMVLAFALPAVAEEPYRQFLDELYRRRMFDVAMTYLDSLRESRLVDEDVKTAIPFNEGLTLIEGAKYERDVPTRLDNLTKAQEKLTAFVQAHPDHPLSSTANLRLGDVVLIRAQANLQLADSASKTTAEKDALRSEAREQFKEAEEVFSTAEAKFQAEYDAFPNFIDSQDTEQKEAKAQARENLILSMLSVGRVIYEASKAYAPNSGEYKAHLKRAAAEFEDAFKQWRRTPAGLYARMNQGRCLQDLGDTKQALSYYGELLVQPDEPQVFRDLKAKVLQLAMECWNSDQEKQYTETITKGEEWLQNARGNEDRTPEGLAIRWRVAMAYDHRASELPDKDPQKSRELKAAVDHATVVSDMAGDFQVPARNYVARMRNVDEDVEPTTFAEAKDAGRGALNAMQAASSKLQLAMSSGEQAEIDTLREELATARQSARDYYNLALSLRDEETAIEDVNQVRYYLCFLNYQEERFYDAAVLGSFIARNYPQSSFALKCAQVTLAAYVRAYNALPADERAFEAEQMAEIAAYMGQQWPGAPEASEAWMTLAEIAISEGNRQQAVDYLRNIPDDSPKRGQADLMAGRALWNLYLERSHDEAEPLPKEDAEALVAEAKAMLERGIKTMREADGGGAANFRLLSAELSLAQIHVGSSEFDEAIEVLEIPDTGPLAMANARNPVVESGNFLIETYKVALRAYVGKKRMDDAKQMMTALDEVVSGSGDTSRLTQIYLSLGVELEDQVARLRNEGKQEELAEVLEGFKMFLQRISEQEQGNTFDSLSWVGDTFYRLGGGLDSGSTLSDEAKQYYEQAAKTYERLLKKATDEPGFAPDENRVNGIRVRLARCDRRLGKYDSALERLLAVLKQKPMALDAQLEAAYNYQDWGATDPENYNKALAGSHRYRPSPNGRIAHLIWGWGRLAQLVQGKEQFRSTYYEARYNVAECYYLLAMTQSGQERTQTLSKANQAITVLLRLGGDDLGGPEWYAKYDRLLKQIQEASGEKPVGLKGIEQATAQRG